MGATEHVLPKEWGVLEASEMAKTDFHPRQDYCPSMSLPDSRSCHPRGRPSGRGAKTADGSWTWAVPYGDHWACEMWLLYM